MLALSAEDVRTLVPMIDAIQLMKMVFAELTAGRTQSPLRVPIEIPERDAVTLFMPASVPAVDGLGVKIVSVFPRNVQLAKPTIHAVVVLVSIETGEPLAILDGTFLTALRTGAASGAATDLLARRESRVLTCIGAGAQALTQVLAVSAVRPIERILVLGSRGDASAPFASNLARFDPSLAGLVVPSADLSEAVRQADIICTATTSRSPVFSYNDVRPGAHINAVGAFTPEMQEIPLETVLSSLLVVDSVDAALAEAGDLIIPIRAGQLVPEAISVELGDIVLGNHAGRVDETQITLFKTVGNAVQDVVVAHQAVQKATEQNLGQRLNLSDL